MVKIVQGAAGQWNVVFNNHVVHTDTSEIGAYQWADQFAFAWTAARLSGAAVPTGA